MRKEDLSFLHWQPPTTHRKQGFGVNVMTTGAAAWTATEHHRETTAADHSPS